MPAGILDDIGMHNLGVHRYRYFRCRDCGTEYPASKPGNSLAAQCNGKSIGRCPYCSEKERTQNHEQPNHGS